MQNENSIIQNYLITIQNGDDNLLLNRYIHSGLRREKNSFLSLESK